MALLNKKLRIEFNNALQTANIYSTVAETGKTDYISIIVDGTKGYIPIQTTNDSNSTAGKVKKNSTAYYIQSIGIIPYNKVQYTSAGTYTFTVPAGITRVKLTVAGGGGGGGRSYTYEFGSHSGGGVKSYTYTVYRNSVQRDVYYTVTYNGGSGGRGGLYVGTISVSPGATYSVTVGSGGAVCSNGGASKFGNIATASGGGAGTSAGSTTEYIEKRPYIYCYEGNSGADGSPSGAGGAGGETDKSGSTGWIYIEYGGDIK